MSLTINFDWINALLKPFRIQLKTKPDDNALVLVVEIGKAQDS